MTMEKTIDGITRNAVIESKADARELIRAERVGKSYRNEKGACLTVLEGMDFCLRDGEVVALLGRSGAGKSTFLRILAGLDHATEGSVTYQGKPVEGPNPAVGFVFQTFALLPWLTVQDNVELGLQARGVAAAERRERSLEAIDAIGLDGFENAYPRELSGGMRQRVGIARAMALRPDVLFMDEPFSALDVLTAENLRSEVLDLWARDRDTVRSVLIVTHNIEEAVEMADRVIVLGSHPGRIVAERAIDLPRPRERHTGAFDDIVDELYATLTGAAPAPRVRPVRDGEASGAAGEAAATEPEQEGEADAAAIEAGGVLAPVTPGDLAGFIDVVSDYADGVDLADLAERLSYEVDDIFPLVDAAKRLGMITDARGHLRLTTAGERWAAADMQCRKVLFARMIRASVPLVRSIDRALKAAHGRPLDADLVIDLLEGDRTGADARRAFDVAVSWGRYAELFDYDAADNALVLDPANQA